MKRRIRPLLHAGNKAMLDRIEMDVIHTTLQIGSIVHGVFIKTALPNTALMPTLFADRQSGRRKMRRKAGFDQPPAQRIICIIRR